MQDGWDVFELIVANMNVHENQSGHLLPVVALINCHHEHSMHPNCANLCAHCSSCMCSQDVSCVLHSILNLSFQSSLGKTKVHLF
jgi:hypothetical protein